MTNVDKAQVETISNRAELEYLTSEIKARLNALQKHADKWSQCGISAGMMLIDLKERLPHGRFIPWLKEHEIHERTAQRWMTEAKDPTKAAERKTNNMIREREVREAKAEWDNFVASQTKYDTCDVFETKPKQPKKTQVVVSSATTQAIRLVKKLDEHQLLKLINLLETNQL